jgi:hypothetical protein
MRAKKVRRIAICHGSPRRSTMNSSPSAPTTAAGMVATKTAHATRSSVLVIDRRESEPTQDESSRTTSRQKYPTTATSVPKWSATSKVWLNSSFSCRTCHSASHGTRIR